MGGGGVIPGNAVNISVDPGLWGSRYPSIYFNKLLRGVGELLGSNGQVPHCE